MTEQGLRNLLATRNNVAESHGWPLVTYYDREQLLADIIAMLEEERDKKTEPAADVLPTLRLK